MRSATEFVEVSELEKKRFRIVVDTNIVMGGLINPDRSSSGRVVRLWLEGVLEALVTEAIRGEYLDIFSKMRFGPAEALQKRERGLEQLLAKARLIQTDLRFECIPDDPADNRFLECAVAGGACYIVTQDRHLLSLGEFRGVRILTASDFLRYYQKRSEGE
ncbi:MAG: putative toxin-antitoxin system toxin component, PIN family [Candidatus Desulforudis sp.]|nr:putative toxin-antitoxin system toxin component, PIN family [Desulforudis sp.]